MHKIILTTEEQLQAFISTAVAACFANWQPPTTSEPADDLLDIQQAAQLLKLTVPTIYAKCSRGELPGVMKVGNRLHFSRTDLMNYLQSGKRKTADEISAAADKVLSSPKKRR